MRRRLASAVVVAAVAAVAILALVDAVRPLRTEPGPPLDAEAAAELADLGFGGTLVYTDADCRVHALALPELVPADPPAGETGCELSVSPDGRHAGPASVRWSPEGKRCDRACAWRGEEPTRAIGGEIRSGAGVLVPRHEVERAVRSNRFAPPDLPLAGLAIRDHVWLSRDAVAALPQAPGLRPAVVATFRAGRLVGQEAYFGRFDRLLVSPELEVLPKPPPRPFPFLTRALRLAGPFDWSPDGRGMAVASRASVFVVDLPSERHVRLPITARDMAWR